jgi:hypothetical protein
MAGIYIVTIRVLCSTYWLSWNMDGNLGDWTQNTEESGQ